MGPVPDKAVAGITKEYPGAKISVAGGYRISAENAAIAARDSALCLIATVAFVAALCFVAFSSRVFAPMALLPPLFGTAAAFCASEILGLKTAALFHVSDSTARKKSLLGGRSDAELAAHEHKKDLVIPEIVCGFAGSVLTAE